MDKFKPCKFKAELDNIVKMPTKDASADSGGPGLLAHCDLNLLWRPDCFDGPDED